MHIEKYKKRAKHNIAESTLNTRLSGQRNIEEFIGEDREPTVDDVEDWVDHLIDKYERGEIKSSTIREYFKAVKYYFQVVKGESEALDHMSKWLPTSDSDPGEHLELEEWEAMRDAVSGYRDSAFLDLMYFYARRPSEVIGINREDIDLEEGTITFPILKKKEDFRATFELLEEPRKSLERWLPYSGDVEEEIEWKGETRVVHPVFTTSEGRISYSTVYNMVKRVADKAGINKNVTPKGMGRHSRATHLDWEGNAPGNIARDMLVHDPDTDVIGRYIHDRSEDDVREVMSLDGEE